MPIYEYKRKDGSTFEVIQKFSDDPLTKDPETGEPVERVYTAPAIHFKGSGFHNTDYGSSRRPKAAGSTDSDSGRIESVRPPRRSPRRRRRTSPHQEWRQQSEEIGRMTA